MDILSTSGINQLISSYKYSEQQKLLSPIQTRQSKYSTLSSVWGSLGTKMDSLKSILGEFKTTSSSSLFNNRSAELSESKFFSVTASSSTNVSSYQVRVNQLAKSDLLVSETKSSDSSSGIVAGTNVLQLNSGDYTSQVSVETDGTETYQELMDKISEAINSDQAVVESAALDASTSYSGTGEFVIDVGGTETTISYDYSNKTYSEVMEDLVSQLSLIDGISAEVVTEGSNVNLKITGTDSSKYITIDSSTDTGTLLNSSNLNIDVNKEKGAAGIASASVFSPTTNNSKFSLTAVDSGYDNRLIISDVSGSLFDSLGLTAAVLADRTTKVSDDLSAGYMYLANSSTSNDLNSKISFNGINIQRNSNSFDDLVSGLTFKLNAVMEDTDTTVSVNVTHDTDTVKSKIDDFIKKFNETYTFIRANQTSGEASTRGIFTGDTTASGLKNQLQNAVMGTVSGLSPDSINSLSLVGITFDPEIGLTLSDSSKLTEAVTANSDEVASLFNSTNGVANKLYSIVDQFVGADGTISKLTDSIDSNINYLKDRIESINTRIDKSAEVLRSRYEKLQQQLAVLLSNSGYLDSLGQGFF